LKTMRTPTKKIKELMITCFRLTTFSLEYNSDGDLTARHRRVRYYDMPENVCKRPVHLAYQPPANSIFLLERISHQQSASSAFLSEQISTSHQPPAKQTRCCQFVSIPWRSGCKAACKPASKGTKLYASPSHWL
jgi:hypothetical protein